MNIKTLTILLIISIFSSPFVKPILAQTKEEKKTEKVKEQVKKLGVGERVKIKVELYNKQIYQGYVSETNENTFVIIDKNGNSNTVKYSEVNKVGGKNLSTGAKIAIGVGIGVGATILTIYLLYVAAGGT